MMGLGELVGRKSRTEGLENDDLWVVGLSFNKGVDKKKGCISKGLFENPVGCDKGPKPNVLDKGEKNRVDF